MSRSLIPGLPVLTCQCSLGGKFSQDRNVAASDRRSQEQVHSRHFAITIDKVHWPMCNVYPNSCLGVSSGHQECSCSRPGARRRANYSSIVSNNAKDLSRPKTAVIRDRRVKVITESRHYGTTSRRVRGWENIMHNRSRNDFQKQRTSETLVAIVES